MPDNAGPLVALSLLIRAREAILGGMLAYDRSRFHGSPDGRNNRAVDGIILVIGRNLFDRCLFGLFKDYEMADRVEQGCFVEQPLNHGFQFGLMLGIHNGLAVSALPVHEAGVIAQIVPIFANQPSLMTKKALWVKSDGISCW